MLPAADAIPLTPDRLEEAAQSLPPAEFDALVDRLVALRARRHAPTVSATEADLLRRIAEAVPLALREQRAGLHALSQQRALTEGERAEYLRLTNAIESLEAARVPLLVALASLRGVSVAEVARQLGLSRRS